MRRSYKKSPVVKYGKLDDNKKRANRKVFFSYDICDCSVRTTYAQYCFSMSENRIYTLIRTGIDYGSASRWDWEKYHRRK